MKYFLYVSFCIALFTFGAFSQVDKVKFELRKKAIENPLDTVFYLSVNDSAERSIGSYLTDSLFKVGRYDDAIKAENLNENDGDSRAYTFNKIAAKLLIENKRKEAAKFIDASYEIYLKEGIWNDNLVEPLTRLGRSDEALGLINADQESEFDSEGEADGRKIDRLLSVTHAFLAEKNNVNALQTLIRIFELMSDQPKEESDYISRSESMAIYFNRVGNRSKANEILEGLNKFAMTFSDDSDPDGSKRDYIFRSVFSIYLLIGEFDKALIPWEKIDDKRPDDRLKLAEELINAGRIEDAKKQLKSLTEQNIASLYVVKIWLLLKEPENAFKTAKSISENNDNYDQQEAFMLIADYLIQTNRKEKAAEVLSFSYDRTSSIIYEHHSMDSIGASTGSRKKRYLDNIFIRYIELGQDKIALEVAKAIDADHPEAKAALALNLARYAKLNHRRLDVKKIISLMKDASAATKDNTEDYDEIFIKQNFAEAFALKGERDRAVGILAELIELNIDGSYEGIALLAAGEVFENYKLPATPAMRESLKAVLKHHDL